MSGLVTPTSEYTIPGAQLRLVSLFGLPVCISARSAVLDWLQHRARAGIATQIVTLNPEMLMLARRDQALRAAISSAELVLADGVGIVWAVRRLIGCHAARYPGIDLARDLLERLEAAEGRVFLLGSNPGVAEAAASRLTVRYPRLTIAGCQHGYFAPGEEAGVVSRIAAAGPDLLLVGMGCPRQEGFIAMHGAQLNCPLMIGAGGTLEVLAGRRPRAPQVFRRLGLEWLWRSLIDPSRWRRNRVLLSFVWLVLCARTGRVDD